MNCSMLGAPAARMCFGTCRGGWGEAAKVVRPRVAPGFRLRAACGRVASAAGLAPWIACRPIGTWNKTPTWLTPRPQAG